MSQERDALGNVMTDSNGLPTHEAWGVAEIPDENPDLSSVKIEFWAYGRKPGVADISTLKGWIKGTLTAPPGSVFDATKSSGKNRGLINVIQETTGPLSIWANY